MNRSMPLLERFLRGVTLATWYEGDYSSAGSDITLTKIEDLGANWISLVVSEYQENKDATSIGPLKGSTPTHSDLIHVINKAHDLGLKVMLKPHIELEDPSQWRGQIGDHLNADRMNQWFKSYELMIKRYAKLAEEQQVELFCVGTELKGVSHREGKWRDLIREVRWIYSGLLTYAATTGEALRIRWWDDVDYIGVDAFYPLSQSVETSAELLQQGWQTHINGDLARLAKNGKPILFTEIGFRSADGANVEPWAWGESGEPDLEEQAQCYEASFRALADQPWLAGMFWWVFVPWNDKLKGMDDDYMPQNKPAERVLSFWYKGCKNLEDQLLFPKRPE